jgi:nucleoside-diphosphate-sugar epimerase
VRAKTAAERAAWDVVEARGAKARLSTIAPGAIVGPLLARSVPNSIAMIRDLLNGATRALPHLYLGFVDPRDLADLHIRAMLDAKAGGERFIASGPPVWLTDLPDMLRAAAGEAAAGVSAGAIPSAALREAASNTPGLRQILPDLDVARTFSSAKAERMLGWSQRPLAESLADCARSLQRLGLV